MERQGALLFKPGTLIMFFFIAVFGFIVFNWASGTVTDSVDDSGQQGQTAIECSNLKTEVLDINKAENGSRISFIVNKQLEEVYILAKSSNGDNITRTVEEPVVGDINHLNVDLRDISAVSIETPLCETSI